MSDPRPYDRIIDDLVTLLDACNVMAERIRADWSDPRSECRAVFDAHDLAHVLTGGDTMRKPWDYLHGACSYEHEWDAPASEDVKRRVTELVARALGTVPA